jgi:ubiquinol-cytochrome c reductase cytochrome b subunit
MTIGDWLDRRTGWRHLRDAVLDEPVPGGARLAYVFGSVLVASLVLQAITGVAMMTVYAPSATTAWASVEHLQRVVPGGWLVRGLHHFGAQAMVVAAGLHLAQVAIAGAYKSPREVNWWLGLALLAATLGFALTGYLLPWDAKGYWATRVATNIVGTVPLVGAAAERLLQGGAEYGTLTLTRFYTLHVAVLPAFVVATLAAHLALFRRHGMTPLPGADTTRVDRFFPAQLARDAFASLALLAVVFALAIHFHGAPLDAPADPSTDYPARPEWYFLGLFQLLKYFEGPLEVVGTALLPALAMLYLVALPLVDRGPDRALRPRLRFVAPLGAGAIAVVALTATAMLADRRDEAFQKARALATRRAEAALALAKNGVPPDGPLAMLRRDPETHGAALFEEHCAKCHRLGDVGPSAADQKGPDLTGWGTREFVLAMLDDPDTDARFGRTPYRGEMPSLVHPPSDPERAKGWRPMSDGDRDSIATFLAAEGDEPYDPSHHAAGAKLVAQRCTSCHLFRGRTDDDDALGPELSRWGSVAWIRAQIANPGTNATYREAALAPERKGHMPRFDADLDKADLDVLARWVWRHARGSRLGDSIAGR